MAPSEAACHARRAPLWTIEFLVGADMSQVRQTCGPHSLPRFVRRWMEHQVSSWLVVAFSALMFAAILGLRIASGSTEDATLVLFVAPVAVCAIEFGLRGGLAAALLAVAILVGYEATSDQELGLLGIATRTVAYLVVGGLLGRFVDERRALEARVERHFDLSLDLFCTANFEGYFEELNPAWAQTLGYTAEELCSRPFVEFVHPDDRQATEAEAAKLARGAPTVSFRNRYRTADGQYRWLEWSVQPDAEEQRMYATARDITFQKQAEDALQNQSDLLERSVRERTEALEASRLETLQRLAIAAEYRDDDTHQHTERVGRTAALIARELGLADDAVALIRRAAPLHDIGKVGISDSILLKPGRLTPEEFRAMQAHVEIGARILDDGSFAVVQLAREIALSHHEHWSGAGYPHGLRGESIPLAGRIAAVADVFDALTHDRPYKRAWPLADAIAEINSGSGTQFDPEVAAAFGRLDHGRLLLPVEEDDLGLKPAPLVSRLAFGLSAPPSTDADVAHRQGLAPAPRA